MSSERDVVRRVVIIGSGQGGFQTAASLRQGGFDGDVTIVGEEPGLPYQRPPLSKAYLSERRADKLAFRPSSFFADNAIDLRDGVRAERIDREARSVTLSDGSALPYDHLVIATGTRNRRLPIPGIDLEGVAELRTLAHADDLIERLESASRVAVVGGGFIGLEIASTARKLGTEVTVVEAADRLMARAVSPAISERFQALHEATGTRIVFGRTVDEITGDAGHATGVILSDGTAIEADLVVVGAGVVPNVEIASEAGLDCDNGILVDETLRTSDPDISAIGDCAAHLHRPTGTRIRLESVQNAADQGKAVAARLLGSEGAYDEVPWFWSDQAGAKLQIAGLATDGDEHVAVGGETGPFHVLTFGDGRLVAVEAVDAGAQYMAGRKLLAGHAPSKDDLEAHGYDLRAWMKAQRG